MGLRRTEDVEARLAPVKVTSNFHVPGWPYAAPVHMPMPDNEPKMVLTGYPKWLSEFPQQTTHQTVEKYGVYDR